jgi:hypothetical protein
MQNQWLSANLANIGRIRQLLTEMEYKPIFQDLPLRTVQGLLNGFINEISKLQEEADQLKKENVELLRKLEKVEKKDAEGE